MKVSSKQADATLAKLANVMERNTALATAAPATTPTVVPVATYAPAAATPLGSSTGIRLTPQDKARIREVIQVGLDLQQTLSTSDVIRLALRAFEPRGLSSADIAAMRAQDGRTARVAP